MKQAISEFESYLLIQKGYSKLTVDAYRNDLMRFNNYLHVNRLGSQVELVDTQQIYDFLSYLALPNDNNKPNSAITRARKLASIRTFFNYLVKFQKVKVNPCSVIEVPTVAQKEPEYLSESEYLKLLKIIEEQATPFYKERDLAMITLFLCTGIRVSELTGLTLSNLNFEQSHIKVRRKGNKEQTIPLNLVAKTSIKKYLEVRPNCSYDNLFISRKRLPVKPNTVFYIVQKYLLMAGIKKSKHGPHVLRHTCFTSLLSKNVNPVIIQQLAGHNSFDTTRRYLHLNNKQVREAVNLLNLEKGTV